MLIDGKELVIDDGGTIRPLVVGRGGGYGAGFHAAGAHHFTFVAPGGSTAIETDGVIASGAPTRLYLFGPADALQTRVVSFPVAVPAGDQHISAINLVRSGGVQIGDRRLHGRGDLRAGVAAPRLRRHVRRQSPREPRVDRRGLFALGQRRRVRIPPGPHRVAPHAAGPLDVAGGPGRQPGAPACPLAFLAAPVYLASDGTFLGGVP